MSSLKSFLGRNAGTLALLVVLAASLSLNVFLAAKLKGGGVRPVASGIPVNKVISVPLELQDQDGKPVPLTFADDPRPTVLYVLSPNCGWCKRNEANVQALVAAVGSRFRFIGLSTDPKGLPEYIAGKHLPFPIYRADSEKIIKELNLNGTPQTAVVGRDGKVQKSWTGAYLDKNQKEIEKYFDVKLPGLQEVAANAEGTH